MVRTLELRATQDGVIWPSRPLISARGLLSSIKNLPLTTYDKTQSTRFRDVTFNATGEILAATDEKGRIFVFFITSNRYALVQHLGVPTLACCFSPIRKTELLVTCENEMARCIDVQSQVLISTLRGHRYPARSASFQKSGKLALTASQDAVILWDTKDWSRFRVLNAGPGVEEATFVSRGDLVAVCFQDDTIMMWELESLALRYRFSLPEHEKSPGLRKITVSDDYKVLVASGRSPFIYVWDFEAQTIIRIIELPAPIKEVITHSFLPSHDSMVSILEGDGGLFFLDVAAKKPKIKLEISKRDKKFTAFDIECHGRYLAACTDDGYLLLYDMEIARETALRAQAERKKEGLLDLNENARLATRSGLLSTQELLGEDAKDQSKQTHHPVPSKLIDSLFGATYARRNDLNGSSKEDQFVRDTSRQQTDEVTRNSATTAHHTKAVRPRQHDTKGHVRFQQPTQNPLTMAPGTLNPQEVEVNRKRLGASLKCNGVYPKKYRLLVWRFLLRLPKNEGAFRALVMKGKHPAFVRLHEQYPLQNSRLFRRLHRVLSAIAFWCPAFGEVSYLPEVVYPFVKIFRENDLAAFEASLSVLLHWCGDFLRSLPYSPVTILSTLDKELQRRDPQLHSHMVQYQITAEVYAWSLLKTIFTEVLSEDEWMTLWDHFITYTDKPQLLYVAVLAYVSYFRTALLGASDRLSIEQFFHQQNAIKIQSFLQLITNISQGIDLKLFESQENGGDDDSADRAATYWPLTSGQYPAFASYPKFVVDFQISERNRIALEENEMVQKKQLLEEVEAQCAKLKTEHETWLEQKNMVLAAEEKRRTEALAAERYRILNLKSLDHQTRKRRLERLDTMEKYALQTLDETAKMFQAEYERLEATLEMQKERTDFEIASRQQEEELQRVEFEAEKRVIDIHKQREMEERLQKLRTEFVARVKQQELQDLLKFESWKREDDDRKREVKMKLQRREELAVLYQEKTIRQKLETELMDQLVEKEKELLGLETERKARRKEQFAFDALDHEIDLRKAELEAMKENERDGNEHLHPASRGVDFDDEYGRKSTSSETREDEACERGARKRGSGGQPKQSVQDKSAAYDEEPIRRAGGRKQQFAQRESAVRSISERRQHRDWSSPAEVRMQTSSQQKQHVQRTNVAVDQGNASHAEKLAQLMQSPLHSASSESSFTSVVLERTMEEMTLLEKALRNISSSSSANSSPHSGSNNRVAYTVNQHEQQTSAKMVSERSRSVGATSYIEDQAKRARRSTDTFTPVPPTQRQSPAHETYTAPRAHQERERKPSVQPIVGGSDGREETQAGGSGGSSNTSTTLQRPIAELERELGIRFDDFSDEEEKEGERSSEEENSEYGDGGTIEDDRARLLERAKRLLEEEDFSSDDE